MLLWMRWPRQPVGSEESCKFLDGLKAASVVEYAKAASLSCHKSVFHESPLQLGTHQKFSTIWRYESLSA